MNTHEIKIASAFNRAAATYHANNDIQRTVGDYLINNVLSINTHFANVIDAGCGTGTVTLKLAEAISYTSFTALDIATELLRHCEHFPEAISKKHDSFDNIGLDGRKYDLIFSNLALHWSQNFLNTLTTLSTALSKSGMIAFSIPLAGTFHELEERFSLQQFNTLTDAMNLLKQCGLHAKYSHQHTFIQSFNNPIAALRSIKNTGTHYVATRRHRSLCAKSILSGINTLTYRIGFFIAEKCYE